MSKLYNAKEVNEFYKYLDEQAENTDETQESELIIVKNCFPPQKQPENTQKQDETKDELDNKAEDELEQEA